MSNPTLGIFHDIPSSDYHKMPNSFSSTQLKDAFKDPEFFYKKHIAKVVDRETSSAFDIGTYFHTSILEPHKVTAECAVFEGIRRGKEWDAFKEANKHKAIITKSEHEQALGLVRAVQESPVAMNRINRSKPEVSAFIEIAIEGPCIFGPEKTILSKYGWQKTDMKPGKKALKLVIKTRADALGDDFILDLKSTTGNAKDEFEMRQKVSYYGYDLSAALYLDVFTAAAKTPYTDFIWTFASKDNFTSKSYLASQDNIRVGRAKYMKALFNIADGIENNWVFTDSMGILKPQPFELEHIKENAEDAL